MIKRILITLFIFMVIALLALFLLTGGIGRISRTANSLSSPIDFIMGTGTISGLFIQLPWQPTSITQGPDISNYATGDTQSSEQTAEDIQNQTDDLSNKINDAKTFGTPSPYKGAVILSDRESSDEATPVEEYVVLHASGANTSPVSLSGWSLQSVLTGKRVPLPPASSLFILGVVNPVTHVSLNPGQSAIVNTGISPVGVSFRENICSGYLTQFQTFYPEIEHTCPDPQNALPEIPENLKQYGAGCISFVRELPSCTFPRYNLPSTLSSSCKAYVTNTYTYNGCVNMYQFRTDFKKDTWRLYLGVIEPLWSNEHDIIRLLDADGRTVDVLTY